MVTIWGTPEKEMIYIENKNIKMKNLKSFDDINEGFFDMFTSSSSPTATTASTTGGTTTPSKENVNDTSLWITGENRILIDFLNLIANPKDGSQASESQMKTFLQSPAEGWGANSDGTKKTKGDVIAHLAERIVRKTNLLSPESLTKIHQGKNFTYTQKDKIKKSLL